MIIAWHKLPQYWLTHTSHDLPSSSSEYNISQRRFSDFSVYNFLFLKGSHFNPKSCQKLSMFCACLRYFKYFWSWPTRCCSDLVLHAFCFIFYSSWRGRTFPLLIEIVLFLLAEYLRDLGYWRKGGNDLTIALKTSERNSNNIPVSIRIYHSQGICNWSASVGGSGRKDNGLQIVSTKEDQASDFFYYWPLPCAGARDTVNFPSTSRTTKSAPSKWQHR